MQLSRLFTLALMFMTTEAHGWHVKSVDAGIDLRTEKVAFVAGSINKATSETFVAQVLRTTGIPGDRLVVINSDGGEVAAGEDMIDVLEAERSAGVRVVCFVANRACSMAFNILTHCDVRIAHKKAELMFHAISYEKLQETSEVRLTAIRLRELAAELDEDDRKYSQANRKALRLSRKDYKMYSDKDHPWLPIALLARKYLHGLGTLSY